MPPTITQGTGRVHAGENDVFWQWATEYPGVLAFHGATNTAWTVPDDTVWFGVPAAVANAGLTMLAAGFGGDSWGNDTAIAETVEAAAYLQGAMAASPGKIALLGGSMGGLNAINYARAHPEKVSCLALIVPVVDLADMHDNNRGGLAAGIETAYGGSSGYAAAVAAKNPAVHTAEIAALGIPIRIWYSTTDTVAVTATQTAFGAAVGATMTSLGAIGHSMSSIVPSQVAAFISTYRFALTPATETDAAQPLTFSLRTSGLTLDPDAYWQQLGTALTVHAAVGRRREVTGVVTSVTGGPCSFRGADAADFEVSLNGTDWAPSVTVPAGDTPVWLAAQASTPGAIAAEIGVPA